MIRRALEDVLPLVNDWYLSVLNLPPQASSMARQIDALHYVEITFYTLVAVAFMGSTVLFLIVFRRRGEPGPTPRIHAPELIVVYACGMFAVFAAFWFFSFPQYIAVASAPRTAMPVYVTAKQWTWTFAYPEGVTSAGVLYLPAQRPVRFVLGSRDVIHSFYLPEFRVKQDVIPGAYTMLTVEAERPGTYSLLCAELCGIGHARMHASVVVLEPGAFQQWLQREQNLLDTDVTQPPSAGTIDLPALGRRFAARQGCLNCHTLDGRTHIGPTFAGLYGRDVRLQDGSTVVATPEYITESMMDPSRRLVTGFDSVMPSYQGVISPQETAAVVELIRSLRDVPLTSGRVMP